jgi:hypothetical protein
MKSLLSEESTHTFRALQAYAKISYYDILQYHHKEGHVFHVTKEIIHIIVLLVILFPFQCVEALNDMIWKHNVITIDRLVLCLVSCKTLIADHGL